MSGYIFLLNRQTSCESAAFSESAELLRVISSNKPLNYMSSQSFSLFVFFKQVLCLQILKAEKN
jgi:hypothetical protein